MGKGFELTESGGVGRQRRAALLDSPGAPLVELERDGLVVHRGVRVPDHKTAQFFLFD